MWDAAQHGLRRGVRIVFPMCGLSVMPLLHGAAIIAYFLACRYAPGRGGLCRNGVRMPSKRRPALL
ncbi:aldo/keto reductase [Neisseria meningitidis]|nr:aldo/keto reductase [Neisseria meningitidis M7124]ANX19495.1 aldo/keto reductase [Neisseria meningitidis]ANX26211.1 aldo/keto reductase [Neisseria meningitidis]ANX30940.1 aldo/keto reductase [Neisseria meningitidis]ANX31946.1 aldo/keto reductase [Neisseria meningitidis]